MYVKLIKKTCSTKKQYLVGYMVMMFISCEIEAVTAVGINVTAFWVVTP
jgi:hypothetical protein